MTIGHAVDLFFSVAVIQLMNASFSVVMALTTLISAAWVAYRNHYDFRRAFTQTVLTMLGAIGLNGIWFLDAGSGMFEYDSMRVAVSTMLLIISIIVAYWIAAIILYFKPGVRTATLNSVADWLQKQSEELRIAANSNRADLSGQNLFRETAQQLRMKHAANTTESAPKKKKGRPKKVVNNI